MSPPTALTALRHALTVLPTLLLTTLPRLDVLSDLRVAPLLLTADFALLTLACRPKQRPESQLGERDRLLGVRDSRLNDLPREKLVLSSIETIAKSK